MQVFVRDNNVEQALRILKKKMQREGVFKEIRRARFYEKPSVRAAREKADAIRRARKLARKQAIREGLIAAPVRKPIAPRQGPESTALQCPCDHARINARASCQSRSDIVLVSIF
jgi:small subunit ribosomal protein S21